MKNLRDVAKHAGINNIECPHCKHRFDTDRVFKRLFKTILDLASAGERVNVGIAIVYTFVTKGRINKSPILPAAVKSIDGQALRIKMSKATRRMLNPKSNQTLEYKRKQEEKKEKWEKTRKEREAVAAASMVEYNKRKKASKKKASKKKASKKKA